MAALLGVGVLVKGCAVETAKAVRIIGKVAGDPVENDAKAAGVAGIDQRGKILRRTEAAGRCKQPGRLIAPGAVKRMLTDRQKLDMGKAEVVRVSGQLFGKFAIGQPLIVTLAPPRAKMHLVD